MARKEPAPEEDNELTEGQRLSVLEKGVNLNRIFMMLLAILIVVTLAVSITIAIISSMTGKKGSLASAAEIADLQAKVQELRADLELTRTQLERVNRELPALRETLNNSSAPAFQRILIEQEKGHQEFIKGVKEGMYDLARMVPGSRTWLELYAERMDKAATFSRERQRQLQRLDTGEILIEP